MSAAYAIVYGETPKDRLTAYTCPDRKTAWQAALKLVPGVPPGSHAGGCGYAIENPQDVTFGGALLVDVFNGLTGKKIVKFESRSVGVARLMTVLPDVAQPLPEGFINPPEEKTKVSDAVQTNEETGTKRRGRPAAFSASSVIRLKTEKNPKRAGSAAYDGFALIRDGMTVGEYEAAGGNVGYLRDDAKRGFVAVE